MLQILINQYKAKHPGQNFEVYPVVYTSDQWAQPYKIEGVAIIEKVVLQAAVNNINDLVNNAYVLLSTPERNINIRNQFELSEIAGTLQMVAKPYKEVQTELSVTWAASMFNSLLIGAVYMVILKPV